MTTNKLLQATGDELSRMLGEVLQPEKNGHSRRPAHPKTSFRYQCEKCKEQFHSFDDIYHSKCSIPDPIPLTWESAMKWRDWAVGKFGGATFYDILIEVLGVEHYGAKETRWVAVIAQPEHYLKAAALCKLKQDKE